MFDVFYIGVKPNLFVHECAVESIEQAQQQSRTRYFWWVNYLTDYTEFDFLWEPSPWQSHQRHAWASQWQKDSGTYLVPAAGYTETNYHTDPVVTRLAGIDNWTIPDLFDTASFDFSWHPDLTDPPYTYQFGTQHQRTGGPQYCNGGTDLKFVDQIRGTAKTGATPVIEIDHMDGNAGQVPGTVKTVRYFDNYKDVLTRIANTVEDEYVWIVSSVCDYTTFDFSWHPEFWQSTMLHVFASGGEKFGDTFYMHVPSFRKRIAQFKLLDWYDLNFVNISVPRWPMPKVHHSQDSQVDAIKESSWSGPLALFVTEGSTVDCNALPVIPLWREKTKTVVPCSAGAGVVVVPRVAIPYIKTQVYDYPYIDKTHKDIGTDQPLDVVFISNGEINADYNYEKLKFYVGNCNRIRRVDRVNGRVAAYHAAANASTTPWFFAVFAKLEVDHEFDWTWQPDRMQQSKHYIFHARNPVNGLEYGHMSTIAYNKKLTLNNRGTGLDFTLDSAHEVVPVLSGTAYYNSDAWCCWRTAFRECIKLRGATDVESEYRLRQWLTVNLAGTMGEWSIRGAKDAVEYYESIDGNFTELRKSYEWAWLASYAFVKHGLITNQ
jgi:hypothetical protein